MTIAPPAVVSWLIRMEMSEDIDEGSFFFTEELAEPAAFFDGEAWVHDITFGISEVYFSMGDIEIAATDDRFFLS